MHVNKQKMRFVKYVSQNIIGMLGISAYVLADTVFIGRAEGVRGIAALNLVLPIYNIIFAIGQMIGIGSATRFSLERAALGKTSKSVALYFSNGVFVILLISLPLMYVGSFHAMEIVRLLGANREVEDLAVTYMRFVAPFTPLFMLNYVFNAFVRNDDNPSLSMIATFSSSMFNIVLDYVLMFVFGMGMAGAALATALSPLVGILICLGHFFTKKNTIHFVFQFPSASRTFRAAQLGFSAFMGEIATGINTLVFNYLILNLAGNVGVAAFGVIANISIVYLAVFGGVAQGSQPLLSAAFGKGERKTVSSIFRLSVWTVFGISIGLVLLNNAFAEAVISWFNSQNDAAMYGHALLGIRIYFIGMLFAGVNVVGISYFSAVDLPNEAFLASILRGFLAVLLFALLLSYFFGMIGVWLSLPLGEMVMTGFIFQRKQRAEMQAGKR